MYRSNHFVTQNDGVAPSGHSSSPFDVPQIETPHNGAAVERSFQEPQTAFDRQRASETRFPPSTTRRQASLDGHPQTIADQHAGYRHTTEQPVHELPGHVSPLARGTSHNHGLNRPDGSQLSPQPPHLQSGHHLPPALPTDAFPPVDPSSKRLPPLDPSIGDLPTENHLPKGGREAESSYRDEQIAELFTAMQQASGMTSLQLAQRLQTDPDLMEALEQGALDLLPDWDDISAVVASYCRFMSIDERPILRRLREKLTEYYLSSLSHEADPSHEPVDQNDAAQLFMPQSDHYLKAFAANQLTSQDDSPDQPLSHLHGSARVEAFGSPIDEAPQRRNDISGEAGNETIFNAARGGLHYSLAPQSKEVGTPMNGQQHLLNRPKGSPQELARWMQSADKELQAYSRAGQQPLSQQPGGRQHMPQTVNHEGAQPYGVSGPDYSVPQKPKRSFSFFKLAANMAFVFILLVGFIHWQPNRFWSGVDQLPKPISETIYSLFEFVMPDPLASTYRMNWVFVDDPRMRKADRLSVPRVKKLPPIDFSNLGVLSR